VNPICERCGATAKVMGIASFTLCRSCHKDASGAGLYGALQTARHWRLQRDEARLALMDCLSLLRTLSSASVTAEQMQQFASALSSARRALAQMDTAPEAKEE